VKWTSFWSEPSAAMPKESGFQRQIFPFVAQPGNVAVAFISLSGVVLNPWSFPPEGN
jgi:hypothetical protein